MSSQLVQDLTEAKKVLLERGWTQGQYQDPGSGAVCMIGALGVVIFGEPLHPRWVGRGSGEYARCKKACSLLPTLRGNHTNWNDQPGRTIDEVLEAIDEAIARAEA